MNLSDYIFLFVFSTFLSVVQKFSPAELVSKANIRIEDEVNSLNARQLTLPCEQYSPGVHRFTRFKTFTVFQRAHRDYPC